MIEAAEMRYHRPLRRTVVALVLAGAVAGASAGCSKGGGDRVASSDAGGAPAQGRATPDPYGGNTYEDPGINAFVDVATDPMSAFSADVDTGSYTVMRKYVDDGNVVNPDSVRVEEYVNYFDQDYEPPTEGTFTLVADGAPTPFTQHERSNRLVRLGVRAKDVESSERSRFALTFVIDTSGSMGVDGRMELVKGSLRMLLDELGTGDTVAIVTFADVARVLVPATPASDRRTLLAAIDGLNTGSGTNAEAGLKLGYAEANRNLVPDGVNRVILASDGVANVGTTGPDSLAQQVRAASGKGIQLVTLGVGMGNYNDALMEQLADKGDGFYAYLDSLDEAQSLFRTRLLSTLETVALDANIGVVWDPDKVVRYRLLGFENRSVPDAQVNAPAVDGGEINAGHSVTALYEIELAPGVEDDASAQLGLFGVRWVDPTTKAVDGLVNEVTVGDLASSWEAASPRFRLDATVAQYADVLRENPYAARFDLADVARVAGGLTREIPDDPEVAEFADLTRRAASAP